MRLVDLTGQKFGRLVAVERAPRTDKTGRAKWLCRCECGNSVIVQSGNLRSGNSYSCGCYKNEVVANRSRTHGQSRSPTYEVWQHMISRCTNPNVHNWSNYGGRGIRICDRWRYSFEAFLEDMGERPNGLSIDRIDVDGDYEPDNCQWATDEEQVRNKQDSIYLQVAGLTMHAIAWAESMGLPIKVIYERRSKGWSDYDTIMTPKGRHRMMLCHLDEEETLE